MKKVETRGRKKKEERETDTEVTIDRAFEQSTFADNFYVLKNASGEKTCVIPRGMRISAGSMGDLERL